MKRIIDYAISRSTDINVLRDEVAALIGTGWQPFGSLTSAPCAVTNAGNLPDNQATQTVPRVMYAQALVKYEI